MDAEHSGNLRGLFQASSGGSRIGRLNPAREREPASERERERERVRAGEGEIVMARESEREGAGEGAGERMSWLGRGDSLCPDMSKCCQQARPFMIL